MWSGMSSLTRKDGPAATGCKDRYEVRLMEDVQIGLNGHIVEFDVFCRVVPIRFARRYGGEIRELTVEKAPVFGQ